MRGCFFVGGEGVPSTHSNSNTGWHVLLASKSH